jgi:hypothetical protein
MGSAAAVNGESELEGCASTFGGGRLVRSANYTSHRNSISVISLRHGN